MDLVLNYIFWIALSVSVFCAALAGGMYLTKKLFFLIWKVEQADGIFWKFMDKGIKVLLSISVWLLGLLMVIGVSLLIIGAFYNLLNI